MYIYYHSSKIASILGINYYTNIEEYINIFIEYLYKYQDDLKANDIEKNAIKFCSNEENITNKLNNTGINVDKQKEILNIYKNSNNIKNVDELYLETKKVAEILSDLTLTEQNKILPNIQSKLNCSYGTNAENSAIDLYTKLTSNIIYECNDKLLKTKCNNFYICGKIDGKTKINDKEYIVEIKNRKNRFFDNVPKYEKIQLILYTKLCNNNNICFIQKLSNDIEIKHIDDLDINDEIYNDIVNKLQLYNDLIIKLRNNEKERHKFISLNNKGMYLYLKNMLNFLPYKKI